jgi:DnaJ-class molecular chaperone
MLIVHLVLFLLAAVAVWFVVVLVSPTRKCSRCKGELVARNRWTGRLAGCRKCRGTGRHYRLGATWVHRLRWSVTAELREMAAGRRERKEAQR